MLRRHWCQRAEDVRQRHERRIEIRGEKSDLPKREAELGLVTVSYRLLVSHYAAFLSKASGLIPTRYEWRRREL